MEDEITLLDMEMFIYEVNLRDSYQKSVAYASSPTDFNSANLFHSLQRMALVHPPAS